MAEIPTGTVTFLFTDVESSTQLWQSLGDEMAVALEHHDEVLNRLIAAHDGYVFSLGGDSFAVAFASARPALAMAVEAQDALATESGLRVRMGIHTGEAQIRSGDYFGTEVNRAARLMSAAHGGQIVLSGIAAALVDADGLLSLGQHQLRDLDGVLEIFQHGTDSFPMLRTAENHVGNLAAVRTSFVGRAAELKAIGGALQAERLATCVGIGGVGKSRLAIEAGHERAVDFVDGAWFAPLAPLADGSLVAGAIADAVGLRDHENRATEESLANWFATKSVLLVIDNCEHVIDAAAAVINRLLDAGGHSCVIATSQAPLQVPGERVIPVGPLGGHDDNESVRLFADRAGSVRPDFELTPETEVIVRDICARVDHIPLAIELAASRVRAMSITEIAARLDQRFRLLAGGDRAAPDRHRTLENTLRWSFELLDETQQMVLRRLAVCASSFTAEQAVTVVGDDRVDGWDVFDAVMQLVDRSLIAVSEMRGTSRYFLLESVKAFGRGELEAAGTLSDVVARYVDTFYAFTVDQGAALLRSGDQEAFENIELNWPHIRVALGATAADPTDVRFDVMFAALAPVWNGRGRTGEGARWAAELIGRPVVDAERRLEALVPAAGVANARHHGSGHVYIDLAEQLWREHGTVAPVGALANRALTAMLEGDDEDAHRICDEVMALVEQIPAGSWNRSHAVANVLAVRSVLAPDIDDFSRLHRDALSFARAEGSRWLECALQAAACHLASDLHPANPREFFDEVIALAESVGNQQTASHVLALRTVFELRNGDLAAAAASQLDALDRSIDHATGYLRMRVGLAVFVVMNDDPIAAASMLGFSCAERADNSRGVARRLVAAEQFAEAVLREAVGDEFETAVARGALWSEAQAVEDTRAALRAVINARPTRDTD